jgi:hypothetical protein
MTSEYDRQRDIEAEGQRAAIYHDDKRRKMMAHMDDKAPATEPVSVGFDLATGSDQAVATIFNPTRATLDVLAERHRQISEEGWTPEHDDQHLNGDMALAAATYAVASTYPDTALKWVKRPYHLNNIRRLADLWPWEVGWWKPGTARRMLVKAGALILAEIERLDRATGETPR